MHGDKTIWNLKDIKVSFTKNVTKRVIAKGGEDGSAPSVKGSESLMFLREMAWFSFLSFFRWRANAIITDYFVILFGDMADKMLYKFITGIVFSTYLPSS